MWPFQKKKITTISAKPNSIICIPGAWKDDHEIKSAIIQATNGEYIAAGGVLINVKRNCHFNFEICTYDSRMRESFEVAGIPTGITSDFLDKIEDHNLVVYISAPMDGLQEAENIAIAAEAILKAGGIGVKVETAGKAFEKEVWLDLTTNFKEHHTYEMFVIDSLATSDGTTFSCGMQNLGLKDTIVSDLPFQEAAELIRIFGYYQVVDKPLILPDHTFTPTPDSPRYVITEETNAPYKDVDLLGNPFGVWRLTKQ